MTTEFIHYVTIIENWSGLLSQGFVMSICGRRNFLKQAGLCCVLGMTLRAQAREEGSDTRPNILVIMTDQQFGDGMSCAMGRRYLHTPHMDRLASRGITMRVDWIPTNSHSWVKS